VDKQFEFQYNESVAEQIYGIWKKKYSGSLHTIIIGTKTPYNASREIIPIFVELHL
jgi:hypothetical protein